MNIPTIVLVLGMIGVSFAGCNEATTKPASERPTTATMQQKPTRSLISSEKLQEILTENPDVQLVDVRTVAEFESGHLANAENIVVTDSDFESQINKLDKTKPIYVYCKSGARSARACDALEEMGFVEMYDLKGGITSWKSAGLSIE